MNFTFVLDESLFVVVGMFRIFIARNDDLCRKTTVMGCNVLFLTSILALLFVPEVRGEAGIDTDPQCLFSHPFIVG